MASTTQFILRYNNDAQLKGNLSTYETFPTSFTQCNVALPPALNKAIEEATEQKVSRSVMVDMHLSDNAEKMTTAINHYVASLPPETQQKITAAYTTAMVKQPQR